MTLSEKIQHYRKVNKLSQEELAAQVGVSRQAVSKWELGDATPEVEKLVALARAFGVTTDQLLSPDEPEAGTPPPWDPVPPQEGLSAFQEGVGLLGCLIRRYGWLAGVYVALCGLGIAAAGILAMVLYRQMFHQEFF